MSNIDTSIDGFRYVGINLTQEQYNDLCHLNILLMGEDRKDIPVFNTMIVLKTLGLLPEEMLCDVSSDNTSCNTYEEVYQSFQRKFGKVKE